MSTTTYIPVSMKRTVYRCSIMRRFLHTESPPRHWTISSNKHSEGGYCVNASSVLSGGRASSRRTAGAGRTVAWRRTRKDIALDPDSVRLTAIGGVLRGAAEGRKTGEPEGLAVREVVDFLGYVQNRTVIG